MDATTIQKYQNHINTSWQRLPRQHARESAETYQNFGRFRDALRHSSTSSFGGPCSDSPRDLQGSREADNLAWKRHIATNASSTTHTIYCSERPQRQRLKNEKLVHQKQRDAKKYFMDRQTDGPTSSLWQTIVHVCTRTVRTHVRTGTLYSSTWHWWCVTESAGNQRPQSGGASWKLVDIWQLQIILFDYCFTSKCIYFSVHSKYF